MATAPATTKRVLSLDELRTRPSLHRLSTLTGAARASYIHNIRAFATHHLNPCAIPGNRGLQAPCFRTLTDVFTNANAARIWSAWRPGFNAATDYVWPQDWHE